MNKRQRNKKDKVYKEHLNPKVQLNKKYVYHWHFDDGSIQMTKSNSLTIMGYSRGFCKYVCEKRFYSRTLRRGLC